MVLRVVLQVASFYITRIHQEKTRSSVCFCCCCIYRSGVAILCRYTVQERISALVQCPFAVWFNNTLLI